MLWSTLVAYDGIGYAALLESHFAVVVGSKRIVLPIRIDGSLPAATCS